MYKISFDDNENKLINQIFEDRIETLQIELAEKHKGICHWSKQPLYGEKNFQGYADLVKNYFDVEEVSKARDEFDKERLFGPAPWEK